jgi:hypothetical protein
MKILLHTVLLIELCFLSFLGGRTYQIYRKIQASNTCIQYVLNHNQMDEYFKHKVAIESLYPHAEAYVAMKYEFCMIREE